MDWLFYPWIFLTLFCFVLPHKQVRKFSGSVLKKESGSELANKIDSSIFKVLSPLCDPGLSGQKC